MEATEKKISTPVLLVIFNRPDTTQIVFEAIRQARPTKLYVAADGPRDQVAGEKEKCMECRQIIQQVDWDCDVKTLFQNKNLGCGKGPCTAISWFFDYETEGIILEDDCLPSPSFFPYCAELLERYRHDTRIMEIAGNNLEPPGLRDDSYSYTFSHLIYSWGWATWRRAWKLHDFYMDHYREITDKNYFKHYFKSFDELDFFRYIFSKMYDGDEITNSRSIWDYQWQFACLIHSGLVVVPNRNLVRNIGFGSDATNTVNPHGVGSDLPEEEIEFPLRHPEFVMPNRTRDYWIFSRMHTSSASRMKSRMKKIIPKLVLDKMIKPIRDLLITERRPFQAGNKISRQES